MQDFEKSLIVDNFDDYYETIDKLGQGSFAEVFKVKELRGEHRNLRAVKRIFLSPFEEQDAIVEVENLKKFRSDHIIEYYECFKEDQGNKIVLNVVMNLSSGSLRDLINKKKKFSPSQVIDLMVQITHSMLVLNKNKAMHLDLKPENILYETQDYFKICDFGCSKLLECESSVSFRELNDCRFGTAKYIAPEIKLDKRKVNRSALDVWSFGIILYEIIYKGSHPFKLNNRCEVDKKEIEEFCQKKRSIKFDQVPNGYPIELIKGFLLAEVQKRPTWRKIKEQLIEHYGRYEVEFQDLSIAFFKFKKTMLIFTSIIFVIQKNIGVNPHDFWEEEEEELKKLVALMCNCGYLHGKLFQKCFRYKMEYKMSSKQIKDFKFLSKNFQIEEEKQCAQNNIGKSELPQLKYKENIMRGVINQLYLKLTHLSEKQDLWDSMLHLQVFCNEGKGVQSFFCCGQEMPQTCQAFQILQK